MTLYTLAELPEVEIKGKPTARARRITLRRDARGGGFTVSHPVRISKKEIQRFLDEHAGWIAKHHQPVEAIDYGHQIPFRGVKYEITEGTKRGVHFDEGVLEVKSPNPSRAIAAFLKTQAQLYAPERLDHYASALNKPVAALRWRDPKSRWGSCDSKGVIMLSWRLIMAPDEVFDYVIAHEAAHLVEMNHSERYWKVLASIYPDHQRARKWLRNEGKAIQSLSF